MGIRDLFSSSGRGKARLARNIKTITNAFCQSAERYDAMEQLLADGSEAAYVGLLQRFTVTASKTIEDEEEKGWVYRRAVALDKAVLPALKQFCVSQGNLAWALRVLEDVANETEEWEILDAIIEAHPPGYERDPQTKIQLLAHLQEIDDPKVPALVARYLEDEDETVRYQGVEALIDIADPASLDALVDRLANDKEDSLRLRARILDGLADLEWDVQAREADITANLGNAHAMTQGKVTRR
ncbi:MAG: HEAT repeat domain-containing protein [Myxococcales bacterium FL481]|nr:MAG: HEAT repeat domain-containing protein [Myxococcales bacterium FL481]